MHNPRAGDGAHSKQSLLKMLRSIGHEVSYQSTKTSHWEDALDRPADVVAVAGGDGTVGKVAKRLRGRRRPMAILPLGTANNLAKALGSFGDLGEFAAAWNPDRPCPFDLGVSTLGTDTTCFVEGLGGGLIADSMHAAGRRAAAPTSPGRKTDRALHFLAQLATVAQPQPWEITLDGEDLSGDYLGVEVLNIRFVSTNVSLAANADPSDGLLDLVLIRPDDGAALETYVRDRLGLAAGAAPDLAPRQGTTIRIRPPAGTRLHVDDDIQRSDRAGDELHVTVDPGAVLLAGR